MRRPSTPSTAANADPRLSWEQIEGQLLAPQRRAVRGQRRDVERWFDERELKQLRRLAAQARLQRSRTPVLGNVVFLPGITGSDLCSIDKSGICDSVWISVPRLVLGAIERLKLRADGAREAMSAYRVEPTGINRRYYARAVLTLRGRWNVIDCAFDWRKDIDDAADALATLIRAQFTDQPVHIVAHSMGGLVARNFIRRHRKLWEAMKDPNGVAGGRLVMLGTPNYGSFSIPQVLTGEDTLMTWLARFDLRHNLSELLAITNTFVGSYQLLPAPSRLPPSLQKLYQRETWGETAGISARHLKRAYDFHFDLEQGNTIDPERMVYVAGCRQPTLAGCSVLGRGDFEFETCDDGDGRVPLSLGLLKDVPTYYVDEAHGDLARNDAVLAAVDEVMQSGHTGNLVSTVLRAPRRAVSGLRDYRAAATRFYGDEVERIAVMLRTTDKPEEMIGPLDQRIAADAIISAAMGGASGRRKSVAPPRPARTLTATSARVPLRIRLRWADITTVRSPMIVVGHYRGVPPVNAIGAIDRKLDGWISLAVRQGMIGGSLGETFLIPTLGRLPAQAITVAGMGDAGEFNYESLHTLMANVAIGAAGLGLETLATLLIGWGEGNLDGDSALRGQLEGIGLGLQQFRDEHHGKAPGLRELVLVELKAQKFLELSRRLGELARSDALASLKLQFTAPSSQTIQQAERRQAQLARTTKPKRPSAGVAASTLQEVRIAVERVEGDGGSFRFSALAQSAVVPVREVKVNSDYAQGAAEALQGAADRPAQEKYGRLLYTYLMPEEFHELVDADAPIRLIVDRSTAGFPWEMACFASRRARRTLRWLGLDLQLSRQFRTLLSRPPGMMPPLDDRLRVLVIGDPAPEPELRLPGARAEARRVVASLRNAAAGASVRIEVESRIGASECDPVEILALMISDDFDVIHYAGHGDYDPAAPQNAGWVFGRNRIITATDIFRARRVPHLIFANACFSGALHAGEAFASADLSRATATIAQAFFERGVRNYIGAGWPVADDAAAQLAADFYAGLIRRESIGLALLNARRRLFDAGGDSTWGAYQHYGNPTDLVSREAE